MAQANLGSSSKVKGELGTYQTVKLPKKSGLVFLAWQHGHWSLWHIASIDDLSKLKCLDKPGKKDQINTSDRVKLSDICINCVMNLGRKL